MNKEIKKIKKEQKKPNNNIKGPKAKVPWQLGRRGLISR